MIIVFGSINMDVNMTVKRFPEDGETILAPSYTSTPGGKGANQALAAARAGSKTAIVGCVGDDGPGLRILNKLKRNEVITSGVAKSDDYPTGMATVVKDRSGGNRIIMASGANVAVSADQAPAEILHSKNLLLTQMEVPLEQNAIAMKTAHDNGAKVILNLAPALTIPKEMLSLVDYLIVNQIEAKQLAKNLKLDPKKDTVKLAQAMAKQGKLTCIVTMGAEGIIAVTAEGKGWQIPSMDLEKVADTTGAGDCFCGTFAACLHEGRSLETALKMATVASGLSCLKEGTQSSYPYLAEIEDAMKTAAAAKKI